MKRILTLTTTGLLVTGLALLPMISRADDTVTGGKTPASPQAGSTMAPGKDAATSGTQHSGAPAKSVEKSTTAAPGGAVVKTPAKNPS
jgi:hypothetical protein